MPIHSSISLSKSVGRSADNGAVDVRAVQKRLNDLMRAPRQRLTVDGACGPKTRSMIRDFQKNACGFRWPDSRVDPGRRTHAALNDPMSESLWAKMSVPTRPSGPPSKPTGGGGTGGLDPSDAPKTEADAVDVAMEQAEAMGTLTPSERRQLRELYATLWRARRGAYTISIAGISEENLDDWVAISKIGFTVMRAVLSAAGTHIAALSAAAFGATFLGNVLMAVGLTLAMLHAIASDKRIYAFIATATYVVWWAHGGIKPRSAGWVLDNMDRGGGTPVDRDAYQWAWGTAWGKAARMMEQGLNEQARALGVPVEDLRLTTKLMLRAQGKTPLFKEMLGILARQARAQGDAAVAAALEALAESRYTEYGIN